MSSSHENISDEIREQNKKFRDMGPKKKWEYFWEYYKLPTLAVILVAVIVIYMARSIIENSKDTVMYAALVNAGPSVDYEAMKQAYADRLGVDLEEVFVTIDTSFILSPDLGTTTDISTIQKLMALSAANQIDILAADDKTAAYLAGNGYFADLRTVLPPEMLQKYEPYLVYYTYDPAADKASLEEAGVPYEEGSLGPYQTLEPVPYAVSSEAFSDVLDQAYYGMSSTVGICVSGQNQENSLEFLAFLEDYEP